MACLVAPATVALITNVFKKKIPAKYHIEWLNFMLLGGTVMLIVDHIISGELVPYAPFFTAGPSKIFFEILHVGVPMTLTTIVLWAIMVVVANFKTISSVANQ